MPKASGLMQALFCGGFDLSGDFASVDTIQTSRRVIDVTGLNTSSRERIYGRGDGRIDGTTHFNDAAGRGHDVLSVMPTTDTMFISCVGTTLGDPAAAMARAKQVTYGTRVKEDGGIEAKVSAVSDLYGVEWGRLLTAGKRTDTTATNGSSYDFGAASASGLHAYLMVFSLTGTNVVVTLEQSSDNGVGDAWAAVTGGAFTSATAAPSLQRIATADGQAVERYLRAVTTGTFTDAQFAVVVVRGRDEA